MFKNFSQQNYKKMAYLHLIAIFFVVVDRLLKTWAQITKPISDNIFGLNYSFNANLAFSLPLKQILILSSSGLIIVCLWLYYFKLIKQGKLTAGYLSILILGALSNYFDRLAYGGVLDYFNFAYLFIFNLADVAILLGLGGWFFVEIIHLNNSTTSSGQDKL